MAGLFAQCGWALETVPGVPAAVSRSVPFVSESMGQEIARDEPDTLVAGNRLRRSGQWSPGERTVGGYLGFELFPSGAGELFTLMLGSAVTTQVGVDRYQHRFTPGSLNGLSATFQVGKPTTGIVIPFTYAGCKVASWELAVTAGEYATMGLQLAAISETTLIPFVPLTPPGRRPLFGSDAHITVDGSVLAGRRLRLNGDNALDIDRRPVASDSDTIREPLEDGLRPTGGSLAGIEFRDLTAYQLFIDGTEAALTVDMWAGPDLVQIEANVRFDGTTPNVEDRGLLATDIPFTIIAPTDDDGDGLAVILTNSDPIP